MQRVDMDNPNLLFYLVELFSGTADNSQMPCPIDTSSHFSLSS
jgi:hypothetical protein